MMFATDLQSSDALLAARNRKSTPFAYHKERNMKSIFSNSGTLSALAVGLLGGALFSPQPKQFPSVYEEIKDLRTGGGQHQSEQPTSSCSATG